MWEVEGIFDADGKLRALPDSEVVRLFREGELDGLAQVREAVQGSSWKPLGESELRGLLAAEEEDEDADDIDVSELQALIESNGTLHSSAGASVFPTVNQTGEPPGGKAKGGDNVLPKDKQTASRGNKASQSRERKKRSLKPGARQVSAVYVTGLPAVVDEEDFVKHMRRAGVLKVHPDTLKSHVKVYKKEDGTGSGDALVIYAKPESAALAVKYLDGSSFGENIVLHVEIAKFEKSTEKSEVPKQESDQARELAKRRRIAARVEERRQMGWAEETPSFAKTKNSARVLILRPCFTEEQAKQYPSDSRFYEYVSTAISQQLDKMQVTPRRIVAIARHPLGVVCLKFKKTEDADALLCRCRAEGIDLSPIRLYPGYEDKVSHFAFYDGETDLQAQVVPPDEDTFDGSWDLDALDRLWLTAAGIQPLAMIPPEVLSGATGSNVPALERTIPEKDREAALDQFGDWLDAQSSDDEFAVRAEEQVESD